MIGGARFFGGGEGLTGEGALACICCCVRFGEIEGIHNFDLLINLVLILHVAIDHVEGGDGVTYRILSTDCTVLCVVGSGFHLL